MLNKILVFCMAMLCLIGAIFFSGCMGQDIAEQNNAVAKQKQLLLSEEYVGSDIPLVNFSELISAQALVPQPTTKAYSVNPRVGIEGDYYIYNIHTPHGSYMVKGTHALVQYCYDARIIEMFLNSKHGSELVDGVGEYLKESVTGVGDLISHPLDSVRGVGRSFDVMAKSVRGDIKDALGKKPVSKNRYDRDALPGSSLYSKELLKIAFSMRVDAYTLNPYLQGLLINLAGKREIGRAFFSMVTWVVPGGGAFSFGEDMSAWAQKGLNGGGGSQEVETFISDFMPQDALVRLAGFYQEKLRLKVEKGSAVFALLDNVSYSPRQQAYIAYYLSDLKRTGCSGIEELIRRFSTAGNVFAGIYNTTQLEMIHAIHKEYSLVKKLVLLREQVGVVVHAGQFIVLPLWDHTRDRNKVRDLLVETKNISQSGNMGVAQVWFVGDCDKGVIDVAAKAGLKIRYGVASDQTFRFTSYRKISYKRKSGDPLPVDTGTVTPDAQVIGSRTPSKFVTKPSAADGN